MVYIPILGALSLATGTLIEKIVLRKKKINVMLYQTAGFLGIVLAMIPFVFFFWHIDSQAFLWKNIFVFSLVILFSLIANYFVFYSMKWEKLTNLEPAKMLEPLFVILLAILFSFIFDSNMYERHFKVIILALIAGLALIFSHLRKHHLDFNKYFRAAIFGSFFFALELVTSRLILDYYSPITFYFLRCLFIFLISFLFFRPDFSKLDKKSNLLILITGFIWFIYRVVVYSGYTTLGIVSTTLIIMLSPVFIYLFAWKFLKEKLDWRNIVAGIIILLCVIYGTWG